jgi:hypothetical protein
MKIAEAYSDIREMTPSLLLELTQCYKFEQIKRTFATPILHVELLVTQEDIENMGETLKMIVFFVSPAIIRGAIDLAKVKNVLRIESNWLKPWATV